MGWGILIGVVGTLIVVAGLILFFVIIPLIKNPPFCK